MSDPRRSIEPQDIAAERAALGSILLNPTVAAQALPILKPHHFYRPWHGRLLEAAQALHAAGEPVDPISVHAALRRRGDRGIEGRNTGVLIHDIVSAVPVTASGMHYVGIVLDCAARRRLAQAGVKMVQLAQDGHGELDEVMSHVVHEIACVRAAVDTHHRAREPQLERPLRAVGREL
jgi:replicative DNA helicase